MTERDLARVAWIGGAVLFLIIVMGSANCIGGMPACTKEPCWSLWLRCTWTLINSPVVLALAAILASVIGLGTWKAQLRATARHEVARKVLSALQPLADAIALARHDLEVIKEFRRGAQFIGGPPERLQGRNPQHVAQVYGGPVWTAREHLRKAEIDAVAVIGEEARQQLISVFQAVEMFTRAFANEWDVNIPPEVGEQRRQNAKKWGMQPNALYATPENDVYAQQLREALEGAEDYYRQYVEPRRGKDRRGR